MNVLKPMRWTGSGNICGRDKEWTNISTRKSDNKRKYETNIRRWDVIIAVGTDMKVWTGLILKNRIFGLLRTAYIIHVCMYVCVYACMHVWMYVCMHACMLFSNRFTNKNFRFNFFCHHFTSRPLERHYAEQKPKELLFACRKYSPHVCLFISLLHNCSPLTCFATDVLLPFSC